MMIVRHSGRMGTVPRDTVEYLCCAVMSTSKNKAYVANFNLSQCEKYMLSCLIHQQMCL